MDNSFFQAPGAGGHRHRFAKFVIGTGSALLVLATAIGAWQTIVQDQRSWSQLFKLASAADAHGVAGQTLVTFLLMVLSLSFKRSKSDALKLAGEVSAILMFLIALLPALGYLYDADRLVAFRQLAPIGPIASVAMLLLAAGITMLSPEGPLMRFIGGTTSGAVLVRRLVPEFTLVLVVIGWMLVRGRERGLYDWKGGLVIMIGASIALFIVGVARTAVALNKSALERDRAESALREHEMRFRLIVDATFDGIVVSQGGIIKEVNPGYARMFGYEQAELIGRSLSDLVANDSQVRLFDRVRAAQSGGYDVIGIRKDGSRFTFDTVVRLHGHGAQQIRVAALRDTTAQRKVEDQLRESQKLEAVGRLAGGVAHDFNNLLTVILGNAELLLSREEAAGTPPSESTGEIEQIREAGERAATLTRQLLAFSRQQVLRPQLLSLNTVVSNTHTSLGSLVGKSIELKSVQCDNLDLIEADPDQLAQVLVNLTLNARDAMPNGGTLLIETANFVADEDGTNSAAGRFVQLSITDSGVGMDAATQHRIFEPFFTTKTVGKGTGLGLPSVYGTVQQSGGHIWVHSEPDRGTTFKLYFPVVDQNRSRVVSSSTTGSFAAMEQEYIESAA